VFVPKSFFLTSDREKALYDLHENHLQDEGYERFLNRLYKPLSNRLTIPAKGLEFGCGPTPMLAKMFTDNGFEMSLFDLFYFPDAEALTQDYDFISATEVVEHLQDPAFELNRLWSLLNPGGFFGIMTKRVLGLEAFKSWHYKNDPTHIIFFSEHTFLYLAKEWQAELEFVEKDVVIFTKPNSLFRGK
jgi:hypothetical protein